MGIKGIKTSQVLGRKSMAKVVEWKAWELAHGTKYLEVEVGTSKNLKGVKRPVQDTARMETDAVSQEENPPSMDVDEAFWIDEPDVPMQKRVRFSTCPSSIPFNVAPSPSIHTWKSLFQGLTPT
jgi:hypothetical protein